MKLTLDVWSCRSIPPWLFCAILGFYSCASIPRESVELSQRVGAGIGKSRSAHLATLDAFYRRLRADNDAWVLSTFLPRLIQNFHAGLVEACKQEGDPSPTCSQVTEEDVGSLVGKTVKFRDELQAALDKSRDDAFRFVGGHYADLEAANAGVTGLLASAVDVKDATRGAAGTFSEVTGIEIDTDAIERSVDQFLAKAGSVGAPVTELEKRLSEILEGLRNKRPPTNAKTDAPGIGKE